MIHRARHRDRTDRRPHPLVAAVVAFILTLAGLLAVASPASAAWGSCPVEYVCLYPDANGGGVPRIILIPNSGYGCRSVGQGDYNMASSVWNRTGETVWLTDYRDCSGWQYSILNGAKVSTLGGYNNDTEGVLYL